MGKASNVINGKAFEYACIVELYDAIRKNTQGVYIESSKQLHVAEAAFNKVNNEEQKYLINGAATAARMLLPLEPNLIYGDCNLILDMATDSIAIGVNGDVRDVFCIRDNYNWSIGISCKHNHAALRHPRITEDKDFGLSWIGIPCSKKFINEITPIIDTLVHYGKSWLTWNKIPNKQDDFYLPILRAYRDEIANMCLTDYNIPEKLLSYFFGAYDFYKVIMQSQRHTTTIEGFNMHGTLNASYCQKKPIMKVPVTKMPTKLIDVDFKNNSKTTIILTFNEGWSVSMRLHNKDKIAKPTSLAWDVNLIGVPPQTYVNTRSWYE